MDVSGNVFLSDKADQRIREVQAATGNIVSIAGDGTQCSDPTQLCGDGGAPASAQLNTPGGVALDGAGNIYIADTFDQRVRVISAQGGTIITYGGTGATCAGSGVINCGDGGSATSALLDYPEAVAVDGAGNLYIADSGNSRVRMVSAATGTITTIAGGPQRCSTSHCGDGGAATAAQLKQPYAVAVDGAGNVYIADQQDQTVRMITAATGLISTVAGTGVGCGSALPCGDGGLATQAQLFYPSGIAVDAGGNLYIGDQANNTVRKVTAATGIISSVAGIESTSCGSSTDACGDGAAATSALLNQPIGVAVDGAGNLFAVDQFDQRIRKVSVKGGISFPTATMAGSADKTDGIELLTLNNVGNAALTFFSQRNNNSNYVLANPMSGGCSTAVPVAGGASCLLGEQFQPGVTSKGVIAGSLAVVDNSLNTSGTTQLVPLSGATMAGGVNVTVGTNTVSNGASSTVIGVLVQYGGGVVDAGAITLTVNGSSMGVGTPTCTLKSGHKNCLYPYTGSPVRSNGSYPVVANVAADGSYTAGYGAGTLVVTGVNNVPPGQRGSVARTREKSSPE